MSYPSAVSPAVRTPSRPVPAWVVGQLASIVGQEHVLHDAGALHTYASDALATFAVEPGVVVLPGSTEEVAAVVKTARQASLPIVPRGSGTGLSGGAHCLKYGFTVNHVLAARLVTFDGTVVDLGSAVQDTPGFDLLGVLVGSEGLVGIVTEVTLRILRKPEATRTFFATFPSTTEAGNCVSEIIGSGIVPAAIEMMARLAIEAAKAAVGVDWPDVGAVPLIADMSSDFMWRKFDVSRFDLVYAGAQKNIGPSGVTVVIARREFVERGRKDLPHILQYRAYAQANSLLNTPPTFGIYLVRNVLDWLKGQGGLDAIERRNREKAEVLYAAVDARPDVYRCPVEPASRSVMNAVFRLPTEALEKKFLEETSKHSMVGLKGHRSVGGIRVSMYNAVEPAWVTALASLMKDFANTHA